MSDFPPGCCMNCNLEYKELQFYQRVRHQYNFTLGPIKTWEVMMIYGTHGCVYPNFEKIYSISSRSLDKHSFLIQNKHQSISKLCSKTGANTMAPNESSWSSSTKKHFQNITAVKGRQKREKSWPQSQRIFSSVRGELKSEKQQEPQTLSKMDKSSFILIVTFAAFLVLNKVAQIEGVAMLCGRLSRGKRINKCGSVRHKVKRTMAIHKTSDVEVMDEGDPKHVKWRSLVLQKLRVLHQFLCFPHGLLDPDGTQLKRLP